MNLSNIIRPRPGRIAIRVETKNEWTPAGLYIPVDTARTVHEQRPTQGEIVAIGGCDDEDFEADVDSDDLQVGDIVLFNKHAGHKITYVPDSKKRDEREEIIILQERDILAVIVSPTEGELKVKS